MSANVKVWYVVVAIVFTFFLASCLTGPQDTDVKSSEHAVSWEEQCGDSTIVVEYDGCLLPDDPSLENPWELDSDSNGEPYIEHEGQNCFLVLPVNTDDGYMGYYRHDERLAENEMYSIQARLKIESITPSTHRYRAVLSFSDGDKYASIFLIKDNGNSYIFTETESGSAVEYIDISVLREYRVEVSKTEKVRFYYDDNMFYEVDYEDLLDAPVGPQIVLFSSEASLSYWDYVVYEICTTEIPMDATAPVAEQVEKIKEKLDELVAEPGVVEWLEEELDEFSTLTTNEEKKRKILHIIDQFFQKKFTRKVPEDSSGVVDEIETLLHLMLYSIDPFVDYIDGIRNSLDVVCAPAITPVVSPGVQPAQVNVQMDFKPNGQHVSNSGKYDFAVDTKVTVIDRATLEVVSSERTRTALPGRASANDTQLQSVTSSWDGNGNGGEQVSANETYFMDTTVEYVQLNKDGSVDRYLDQASKAIFAETVSADLVESPKFALKRLNWSFSAETECKLARMEARDRTELLEAASSLALPVGKLSIQLSAHGNLRSLWGIDLRIPIELDPGVTNEPVEYAKQFVHEHRVLYGLQSPHEELVFNKEKVDEQGNHYVWLDQEMNGLPVFGSQVLISLNSNMEFTGSKGLILPTLTSLPPFVITEEEAVDVAEQASIELVPGIPFQVHSAVLGIINPESYEVDSSYYNTLIWKVRMNNDWIHSFVFFINALDGSIVYFWNDVDSSSYTVFSSDYTIDPFIRRIYTHDPYFYCGSFPGTSWPVYVGSHYTHEYFVDVLGRDGFSDGKLFNPLYNEQRASSDYEGPGHVGAHWYGLHDSNNPNKWYLATFGDLATCVDVVGHEFTHGMSEVEVNFDGGNTQNGALDESFSDFFGQAIERYWLGYTDWIMGTEWGIVGSCFPIRHLAYPEVPQVCPQGFEDLCVSGPSNMNDLDIVNVGKHRNSMITTKSAYLLGREPEEGPETHCGITVSPIGFDDTERIWYRVLRRGLTSNSIFADFRESIIRSAIALFGISDPRTFQAASSVEAVGIWSRLNNQEFDTNAKVSIVDNFSCNAGDPVRWIFYKSPDNRLYIRYRNCSMDDSCFWSDRTQIAWTSMSPTTVTFDNSLWIFYNESTQGDTGKILHRRIFRDPIKNSCTEIIPEQFVESEQSGFRPEIKGSPSAVVFNNQLYLFYRLPGEGETEIHYVKWNPDDEAWSEVVNTHTMAFTDVSSIVYSGAMHIFYVRHEPVWDVNLLHRRMMNTDENWSPEILIDTDVEYSRSPSLAIFRDRLFAAVRSDEQVPGNVPGYIFTYFSYCSIDEDCTYRPGSWTHTNAVTKEGTNDDVSLFADSRKNRLYLLFRDADGETVYHMSKSSE